MSQCGQLWLWDKQADTDVQRKVLLHSELLSMDQCPIIWNTQNMLPVETWERTHGQTGLSLHCLYLFTLYSVISWHPVQDTLWALLYLFCVRYNTEALFVEFHVLLLCPLLLHEVLQPATSFLLHGGQLLQLGTGPFSSSSSRSWLAFFVRHDVLSGEWFSQAGEYWGGPRECPWCRGIRWAASKPQWKK